MIMTLHRFFILAVFMGYIYISLQILSDEPMREVVRGYLFNLVFILQGIYLGSFFYLKFKNRLYMLLSVLIPILFLVIVRFRYNGSIEHTYDTLFYISSFFVFLEFLSLFFIKKF